MTTRKHATKAVDIPGTTKATLPKSNLLHKQIKAVEAAKTSAKTSTRKAGKPVELTAPYLGSTQVTPEALAAAYSLNMSLQARIKELETKTQDPLPTKADVNREDKRSTEIPLRLSDLSSAVSTLEQTVQSLIGRLAGVRDLENDIATREVIVASTTSSIGTSLANLQARVETMSIWVGTAEATLEI